MRGFGSRICPDLRGEITGTPASATERETRMVQCTACNKPIKWGSWPYHCRTTHPPDDKDGDHGDDKDDENHVNGNDAVVLEVDNVKPIVDVKDGVNDSGKRPVQPAKRRLSDPKPACIINPHVRELPSKPKKAKGTPASKET